MTVSIDGNPALTLRAWAKAFQTNPQYRFPSDPNAEFFPRDMEEAAAMAIPVSETESGRSMMLNVAMMQADFGRKLFHSEFFNLMYEPWPHYVHYRGRWKPVYCPPDTFGFIGKYGPSDCDWIVPGTDKR